MYKILYKTTNLHPSAWSSKRGGIVATDDRAARSACDYRRIPCTGTIGILRACCRDGSLSATEADAALQAMVDAGFYSPVHRLSDLV